MGTLIMGGLFAVALVALILLVLVLRSEGRERQHKQETAPKQENIHIQPLGMEESAQTMSISAPASKESQPLLATHKTVSTISAPSEETIDAGEFRALVADLYEIRQQNTIMEQRLNALQAQLELVNATQQQVNATNDEQWSSVEETGHIPIYKNNL